MSLVVCVTLGTYQLFYASHQLFFASQMLNTPTTISVIDDDLHVRESIVRLLKIKFSYEIVSFESAVEFLANVKKGATGCVVSDYQMEPMDGLTLLREMLSLIHI